MLNHSKSDGCVDVCPPVRNRYFYGKMLDVFHFELEQQYFNSKRWLLNRLVSGYGVLCGLNVQLGSDYQSIIVTPGIAIDKCGHEIVVCQPSEPQSLKPFTPAPPANGAPAGNPGDSSSSASNAAAAQPEAGGGTAGSAATNTANPRGEGWDCGKFVYVSICYQECPADPVPGMGGDCDTNAVCSPGSIKEQYRIKLTQGKAPARTNSRISNIFRDGMVDYLELAKYVRDRGCKSACPDCCIPLANIRLPEPGKPYDPNTSIDISVRPICYTNDLLYEMILALQSGQSQGVAGKP